MNHTENLLGYRASEVTENEPPDLPYASVGKLKSYEVYSYKGEQRASCELEGGTGFGVPVHDFMPTPKPGADVVVWPGQLGDRFRLVIIDGYVHHYMTEEEVLVENAKAVVAHEERRRDELNANHADLEAREAALIPELAERCNALRERSELSVADWDAHYWPYDLYVCDEAQKIILAVRDGSLNMEALQQGEVREYPGMDEGHSGNTFGASVFLAGLVLEAADAEQAAIAACAMHGAMAPAVGSKLTG